MGYVALKSRMILGQKYRAGDPVDVSDWDVSLINRMKESRRIIYRPDGEVSASSADVETGTMTMTVEIGDEIAYTGTDTSGGTVTVRPQVYHVGGGYYHRLDTGEKVPEKGERRVRDAGYEIVDAPPGAD